MRQRLDYWGPVVQIVSTAYALSSVLRRAIARLGHGITRDSRGNAAVEFALIAAPFAALLVAILQTSLVFFAQQNLETTAEKSVRQLVTGQAQKANLTGPQFKTLVCTKLPAFMKCANVMIDVRTTGTTFTGASASRPTVTFDAAGNIDNSAWQYTPGGPGSVNVVKIMYIWDVAPGPLGFDLSTMSNNRRLLFATSVFRTEPYS